MSHAHFPETLPAHRVGASRDSLAQAGPGNAEARFAGVMAMQTVGVLIWNPDATLAGCNDAFLEMSGFARDEVVGLSWQALTPPEFRQASRQALEQLRRHGEAAPYEKQYLRKDGTRWWGLFAARRVGDETLELVLDVSERRQAQDALAASQVALHRLNEQLEARVEERTAGLRDAVASLQAESAERAQAEQALRQVQKMDAVGQLTGGLAHDFNNMLAAIMGSLDLLAERLGQGQTDRAGRYLEVARGAAERAAALTQRLLAFSRRQALDPQPTDAAALVEGMAELIGRTIGPSISLKITQPQTRWLTLTDPHQLESALLNLCINARDAMPMGGRLQIKTSNLRVGERKAQRLALPGAGDYVTLRVVDNGSGMPQTVLSRAFEPFFTTKSIGQGTGLGLSMVYGFVRQSHGQVDIRSVPEEGTEVVLYLPRCKASKRAQADEQPSAPKAAPQRGGARVLVVDDEAMVRMLVTDVLRDLGHVPVEAASAPDALMMLQADRTIDLLVTDVGLPGRMNGHRLAKAARALRPGLGVLFITGYDPQAASGDAVLEPGMQMLAKPFPMDALATRISEMTAHLPDRPVHASAPH